MLFSPFSIQNEQFSFCKQLSVVLEGNLDILSKNNAGKKTKSPGHGTIFIILINNVWLWISNVTQDSYFAGQQQTVTHYKEDADANDEHRDEEEQL